MHSKDIFLLKFMFLALCGGLGAGMSQIVITLYAVSLGASSSEIGLIQGLPNIGVFLTVLPMGFLVDHYGAKRIFMWGGLLGAFIYLFMTLAATPSILLLVAVVFGLFMSFRFVSMNSVFLDYLETNGTDKAGWYRASHSVGLSLIGPMLGGYLANAIGYRWSFVTVSVLFVVAVVAAKYVLIGSSKKDAGITVFSFNGTFGHVKTLLKNKDLVEASLIESTAVMAYSCFTAFIVVIALRVFHLPEETSALFISINGAFFTLALFSLGSLYKRIGQRKMYLLAITSIVTGLLLIGLASDPQMLFPGSMFLGTGLGSMNLINVTRTSNINGKKGKVAGVFSFFTVAGMIIGPIAGGFVGGMLGLQTVFLLLVPVFFVLGIRIYSRPEKH